MKLGLFKRKSDQPFDKAITSINSHKQNMSLPVVQKEIWEDCLNNIDSRINRELDDVANVISSMAADIIREAALLLILGIVDHNYAEASTTANKVLYLVNLYRGQNLQGERYNLTLNEKRDLIIEAQAQVISSANLIAKAKKDNKLNIEMALEKQKKLTRLSENLLSHTS
jgi:hypothetical protein